jgi:hypothetical protein
MSRGLQCEDAKATEETADTSQMDLAEGLPASLAATCDRHIRLCLPQSSTAAMGRSSGSEIGSHPWSVGGSDRIASWMQGARLSKFMICVSRARVTWPSRADSAW